MEGIIKYFAMGFFGFFVFMILGGLFVLMCMWLLAAA